MTVGFHGSCVTRKDDTPATGDHAMTNRNEAEGSLRDIFRSMDVHRAQEIREAYYKAVEGLSTLATALEIADVEVSGASDNALIEEHLIACQAMDALKMSLLGRIL